MAIHGDHEQLILRRGLAEMGRGRTQQATHILNVASRRSPDTQLLLTEINRHLRESPLTPNERDYLVTHGRMAVFRDLKMKGKTNIEVKVVAQGERLELVAVWDTPPQLRPATPSDMPPNSRLYLDDAAGLHSRDWSPGARQKTLQQAIEGEPVELYMLYNPDPAFMLNPEVVEFGKSENVTRLRQAHTITPFRSASPPCSQRPIYILRSQNAPL